MSFIIGKWHFTTIHQSIPLNVTTAVLSPDSILSLQQHISGLVTLIAYQGSLLAINILAILYDARSVRGRLVHCRKLYRPGGFPYRSTAPILIVDRRREEERGRRKEKKGKRGEEAKGRRKEKKAEEETKSELRSLAYRSVAPSSEPQRRTSPPELRPSA